MTEPLATRHDVLLLHAAEVNTVTTRLSIDPDLIERAFEVSGERTRTAAVTRALEEFIARRRQGELLDLMGKLERDRRCDYKMERRRGLRFRLLNVPQQFE